MSIADKFFELILDEGYYDRPLSPEHIGTNVKVYRNLHSGLWTVANKKTGNVMGHTTHVRLKNSTFTVGQAASQRVKDNVAAGLPTGKTVHAFVNGTLVGHGPEIEPMEGDHEPIRYNPRDSNQFHNAATREPIHKATDVYMQTKANERVRDSETGKMKTKVAPPVVKAQR